MLKKILIYQWNKQIIKRFYDAFVQRRFWLTFSLGIRHCWTLIAWYLQHQHKAIVM